MKIALVCDEYPPQPTFGGIGTFTHTLAHALVAERHQVTVVGIGSVAGQRDDVGVRVVTLPQLTTRGIAWFVNRRRLLHWLKKSAQAGDIELIEVPDFEGMLPFRFSACPIVVRLHLSNAIILHRAGQTSRRLLRLLEWRMLSLHRNWIGVSSYILHETASEFGVTPNRSTVIFPPICRPKESGSAPPGLPDEFALYAGTVSDRKGAFVLAEAARSFLTAVPSLHLVYVGGLTKENGLSAKERIYKIVGCELASRVHCLGFQERAKVLACMSRAKVFVFPSKLEACAAVPVEAMCCGIPVVYTTSASGPEVIDDGVTGLLADPHSSHDVAEKVLRVLGNPELAETLAKNGQRFAVDRFSVDRCLRETIAFYQQCLQSTESRK